MCDYKTLYNNEHGYVVKCKGCLHLHLAFGSTLLVLTQEQFYEFARDIDECYNMHQSVCCRNEKRVQVPTAVRTVILLFSVNDLDSLRQLLKSASDVLQREKLFEFNYN